MDNPGDYYAHKDKTARLLADILAKMEDLRQLEPHVDYGYIIGFLRGRLEMARYVGD